MAEHANYIEGYGFISDLVGETILGVPKAQVENCLAQGYQLKSEFIEDASIPQHEVKHHEVPYMTILKGTLKVWVYIPDSDYHI